MLIITHEQIVQSGIAEPKAAQAIIERTFRHKADGLAVCAQEIAMIPEHLDAGAFYSLPGYLAAERIAGIKWTSHVHKQAGHSSSTHPMIMLNDLDTGMPRALLDGLLISGLRTGAVSATAIKLLANPDAGTLLVCGSGYQARHQLMAVIPFLPRLKTIYIWSRHEQHARRLAESLRSLASERNLQLKVLPTLPDCLDLAEIVIGITSATTPYLQQTHFVPGHLYIHAGIRDVTPEAIAAFDHIICDDYQSGVLTSSQSLFELARQDETVVTGKISLLEELLCGQVEAKREQDRKQSSLEQGQVNQQGLNIQQYQIAEQNQSIEQERNYEQRSRINQGQSPQEQPNQQPHLKQNAQHKLMFNAFGLQIFDLALAHAVLNTIQERNQTGVQDIAMFEEIQP
ncbi:ornithine cyclodeaminase family protein [Paenibacillus massiliensis]|uniref:ornithine cyclodeaminase family protein n=1 Tax=Paenibacillus massiliensis TaxID=225917 RepID=UPI0003FB36B5|nr:ornithine cyclodeaminase family protein [Paenibacillus massiliensis]